MTSGHYNLQFATPHNSQGNSWCILAQKLGTYQNCNQTGTSKNESQITKYIALSNNATLQRTCRQGQLTDVQCDSKMMCGTVDAIYTNRLQLSTYVDCNSAERIWLFVPTWTSIVATEHVIKYNDCFHCMHTYCLLGIAKLAKGWLVKSDVG